MSNGTDILVVDDTPADLQLLTQLLSQTGYRPRHALTASMALQSVVMQLPDLLVLDVKLPDLDGYSLCRQIQQAIAPKTVPIIFISALDQPLDKVKAFEAGAVDYIPKPYEASEVLARIELHLTNQRLQNSLAQQNQQLRAQEERWKLLLQGTHDGVWDWDIQANEVTFSVQYWTMLGYDTVPSQGSVETWESLLHPDDKTRTLTVLNQYLNREKPTFQIEFRLRCQDGSYKWVLSRGQATWDNEGTPIRIVGIHQDISDRKRTEANLREVTQRLALATNAAQIGIWELDLQNQRLIWDDWMHTLYNVNPSEFRGTYEEWTHCLHPEDLPKVETAIQAALNGEQDFHQSFRVLKNRKRGNRDPICYMESYAMVLWENQKPRALIGVTWDITQDKLTELRLQEQNNHNRAILSAIPDLITILDEDGVVRGRVPSGEINDLIPDHVDALDQPIANFVPEEVAEQHIAAVRRVMDSQQMERYEQAIEVGDRLHYEEVRVVPYDENSALLMMRNISDRKQSELALHESELTRQAILEAIPDLLIRLNKDGIRLDFISGGEIHLSPDIDYELQQSIYQTLPTETADLRMFYVQKALETGDRQIYEHHLDINGDLRYEETRIVPLNDAEVLVMVRDITDRKQAELALKAELDKSLLIKDITVKIRQSLDPEVIFQTTAQQLSQVMRVSRCLIHQYVDSASPTVPFVAEYLLNDQVPSILDLEIPIEGNPHVQQLLAQNRAIASDDVYADPLLENAHDLCQQIGLKSMLAVGTFYKGQPNGIIGLHQCDRQRHWTAEDIELIEAVANQMGIAIAQSQLLERERKQRQALELSNHALQIAKQDAEEANQAKSRFLASMSHELRTPLNAILGYAQILVGDPELSSHYHQYVETILHSGDHLLNLINEVLDLAKVEAGRMVLDLETLHLPALLQSIQTLFLQSAQTKRVDFNLELGDGLPTYIITDVQKLRQILINLLGNALKFTQQGHVTLRVKLETMQPLQHGTDVYLTVQVEDTGIGIAPDEQAYIFNAFEQAPAGRNLSGSTGLGLSISQHFVSLLGGELHVSSQVGVGSTFYFTMPVQLDVHAVDATDTEQSLPIIGIACDGSPPKILIVDDEDTNRQLLLDALQPLGFEVLSATSGQQALSMWQHHHPELILLDLKLPDQSGHEVAQSLRKQEQAESRSPVPIVIISASALDHDRIDAIATGCQAFLEKPIKIPNLLQTIAQHLHLNLVYDNGFGKKLPYAPSETLDPKALCVMGQDWVLQLNNAAILCDTDVINQLIQQIPEQYAEIKKELSTYSYNFEIETIMNVTQRCLDHLASQPCDS